MQFFSHTSHISGAQWPHVASGNGIGQHRSREETKPEVSNKNAWLVGRWDQEASYYYIIKESLIQN